jgi:hypothetical protein
MRALSLLVLAIAGLAHAAPAPLPQREQGPEYPPVLLNGWLPEQHLTRNPSVIVCQSDYQAAAKALGIQDPPRVNFRTHFLFIHISSGYGQVTCAIDGNGDLRAVGSFDSGDGPERFGLGFGRGGRARSGLRYLVQSFPRSAVKTVNGAPLPKR